VIEIIHQYDPNHTEPELRPADAEQAQDRLTEGNRQLARFWNLPYDPEVLRRDVFPFDPSIMGIAEEAGEIPSQAFCGNFVLLRRTRAHRTHLSPNPQRSVCCKARW
jgi:hypothetical protein